MSWHLPHQFTTLHRAVSIALSCSISTALLMPAAQAVTLGQMQITSKQHEPLTASIDVSGIKSANFNASIANSAMYRQMGLTPTAAMSVRFVPTSATSGQLLLSTAQPVSAPFADVVLNLRDDGQQQLIPKTLLMPLGHGVPIKPSPKSAARTPNQPKISMSQPTSKPLTVRRGTPPPLFDAPASSTAAPVTVSTDLSRPQTQALPVANVTAAPNLPTTSPSLPKPSPAPRSPMTATAKQTDDPNTNALTPATSPSSPSAVSQDQALRTETLQQTTDTKKVATQSPNLNVAGQQAVTAVNPTVQASPSPIDDQAPASTAANRQQDILNIQVTRQIKARNQQPQPLMTKTINTDVADDDKPSGVLNNLASEKKATTNASSTTPTSSVLTPSLASAANTSDNRSQSPQPPTTDYAQNTQASTISYTVQRNDNLWIIADQLAEQNNLNVQTVMKQIQAQNPDAFINANADRLKANATLDLPNYEVVPSQQSLQTAIAAQRQYYLKTETTPKATKTVSNAAIAKAPNRSTPKNKPKKTTKTLPQARFSVLAPNQQGRADGTQSQKTAGTNDGNGLSSDILATLKSSRQRTADQAQRVAAAHSSLSSYTQKIKLQNQKLAELEARLKKLRNQ